MAINPDTLTIPLCVYVDPATQHQYIIARAEDIERAEKELAAVRERAASASSDALRAEHEYRAAVLEEMIARDKRIRAKLEAKSAIENRRYICHRPTFAGVNEIEAGAVELDRSSNPRISGEKVQAGYLNRFFISQENGTGADGMTAANLPPNIARSLFEQLQAAAYPNTAVLDFLD